MQPRTPQPSWSLSPPAETEAATARPRPAERARPTADPARHAAGMARAIGLRTARAARRTAAVDRAAGMGCATARPRPAIRAAAIAAPVPPAAETGPAIPPKRAQLVPRTVARARAAGAATRAQCTRAVARAWTTPAAGTATAPACPARSQAPRAHEAAARGSGFLFLVERTRGARPLGRAQCWWGSRGMGARGRSRIRPRTSEGSSLAARPVSGSPGGSRGCVAPAASAPPRTRRMSTRVM